MFQCKFETGILFCLSMSGVGCSILSWKRAAFIRGNPFADILDGCVTLVVYSSLVYTSGYPLPPVNITTLILVLEVSGSEVELLYFILYL